MIELLIIPAIYLATTMSGGQYFAPKLGKFGFLPELVFGLLVAAPLWGSWWYALCVVSYLGITTGLHMIHKTRFGNRPDRAVAGETKIFQVKVVKHYHNTNTIGKYLLDWWWRGDIGSTNYCRVFMFIKGLIAHAPLLWFAPVGGIAWAVSYEYSFSVSRI
jgi:hypothetical protein